MRTIKIAIILFFLMTGQASAYVSDIVIGTTPTTIQFHVEDSSGSISGYTPSGVIYQIPNLSMYYKGVSVDSGIESNRLEPKSGPVQINNGKYKFILYGTNIPQKTQIIIELWWTTGIPDYTRCYQTPLIYPNSVWTYEFDVPAIPTSDGRIILTKVSTTADFIKDIKTAGQLGYIGNKQYADKLVERVAQVALLKGDQKKGYEDISSELTSLYSKPEQDRFIKKEGYDVLKEDLDYIISHL